MGVFVMLLAHVALWQISVCMKFEENAPEKQAAVGRITPCITHTHHLG